MVLGGMMEPVASHIYAGVYVRTVVFPPSCFLDIGPVARIRPFGSLRVTGASYSGSTLSRQAALCSIRNLTSQPHLRCPA